MSDLREAVAKAIYESNCRKYELLIDWPGEDDIVREYWRSQAEDAIAAYEAHQPEPTEAEIDQAYDAHWNTLEYPERDEHDAMRAALTGFLAARKAGQ